MSNRKPKPAKEKSLVRITITLQDELDDFASRRAQSPEYCGNVSSYVRSLILRDRDEHHRLKAA